jgi:hypothetical protein
LENDWNKVQLVDQLKERKENERDLKGGGRKIPRPDCDGRLIMVVI